MSTIQPGRKKKRKIPSLWHVILHNDDHNQIEYVINKVMQITKLSKENAIDKVKEINEKEKSTLVTVHLELAELYVEQLTTAKLIATLQRAS